MVCLKLRRTGLRPLALLVLPAALLLLACGDDGGGAGPTAIDPSGTATVAAPEVALPDVDGSAAGCSPARPHAFGTSEGTITSGGTEREYLLHVPASYIGEGAVPLVLNLHGLGSNAREQAGYSDLPAKADAEGFLLVSPEGAGPIAFWDIGAGSGDVSFIRELLDELEADLCVDPARIFSTGISNGALMSSRLACDLSDRLAAIAPVAGALFADGCAPDGPVPVIAFHGTEDRIIPFEGGPLGIESLAALGIGFPAIEESVAAWAESNGCQAQAAEERVSTEVRRLRYAGCDADAAVEFYIVEGGGHVWPDGAVGQAFLGHTTREISATDLLWQFFQEHPKE